MVATCALSTVIFDRLTQHIVLFADSIFDVVTGITLYANCGASIEFFTVDISFFSIKWDCTLPVFQSISGVARQAISGFSIGGFAEKTDLGALPYSGVEAGVALHTHLSIEGFAVDIGIAGCPHHTFVSGEGVTLIAGQTSSTD